jgi:flagellar assembly factor FliW
MQLLATDAAPEEFAESFRHINLPNGLIGLMDLKRFELVSARESQPFLLLRSLDTTPIEFVVIEPHGIFPDYPIELSDEDARELGLASAEDNPLILNILTIRSMNPQKVTANLVAPIVINRQCGTGRQVVLANYSRYSTTYPLIAAE